MQRRRFLSASAATGAAALSSMSAQQTAKKSILELRFYYLRNSPDQQMQRTSEVFEKIWMPAAKRAGSGPAGAFASLIGPNSPYVVILTSYPSLAVMEAAWEKMEKDQAFTKALDGWYKKPGLAYQRSESWLLRGFDSVPNIEVPPPKTDKTTRIFELRTYESNNGETLRRKIKMFDDGEVAIFRRLGLRPVFFGQTLVGGNMPNLTYLLAFDSLAHREQAWRTFIDDPEWHKLRATPGLSDAEVVSNIGSQILRPLPFSDIR
jgi:hypothetical protein